MLYKFILCISGKEFCSELNAELFRLVGVEHRMTAAYNPRCNGLVERLNRTTQRSLVACLLKNQANWYYIIPSIEYSLRTVPHSSTGRTPFEVVTGRKAKLPVELKYLPERNLDDAPEDPDDPWKDQEAVFAAVEKWRSVVQKGVAEQIVKAQKKQSKDFNARHQGQEIKVGDLILVENTKDKKRLEKLLTFKWFGPYKVERITEKGNLEVRNPKSGQIIATKVPLNRAQLYIPRETYLPPVKDPSGGKTVAPDELITRYT